MSKVIFINNYREGTGYSEAGIDFILALDAAGADVVPRHLSLSGKNNEIPARVLELEQKNAKGADVNIQYTLPSLMGYNGHYRNVGLFDYETTAPCDNTWGKQLNLMDQVLVTNDLQKLGCINELKIPLEKVGLISHTADITKYQKSYEPLDIPELKDKFVFYFIGELNKRKNLEALLKAFHLEFNKAEDVELVLKVNIYGLNHEDTMKELQKYCAKVKSGMRIYNHLDRYKNEILMTQRLSQETLMSLHSTCDCFVAPAYGEGWSKPAFDAMAMGKTPIVTNVGGMSEYITEETGWPCDFSWEPAFGCDNDIPDLYTSTESWARISIDSLRQSMRAAFENKDLREQKSEGGINAARQYSYEKVGKKLRKLINV
jgi:glycosyltransferase involved in cell wall biosynthesis